ncbi:unnamed protein product [Symbiodinium sp. CCMP2592]|nr:unnamed protein product [Symbiodinium sp. CCMP2592]
MTPMPCSGAATGMEMGPHGLIRDDDQSFGKRRSPSEWSSPPYWSLVEQISKLIKEKDLLLNESPSCSSAVCMKDLRRFAGRHEVRASLRCSDLRNDNQALRIDNEKLHEALLNCSCFDSWPL